MGPSAPRDLGPVPPQRGSVLGPRQTLPAPCSGSQQLCLQGLCAPRQLGELRNCGGQLQRWGPWSTRGPPQRSQLAKEQPPLSLPHDVTASGQSRN